jgi:hypothetical protein
LNAPDDSRPTASLQQPQEQRDKQQLRLLRLDDLLQVLRGRLIIQRPGKRRIREHQAVFAGLILVLFRQRVAALDVGVVDAMQQHVHAADAQHGGVGVKPVEEVMIEVEAQGCCVEETGIVLAKVLGSRHQEAACS